MNSSVLRYCNLSYVMVKLHLAHWTPLIPRIDNLRHAILLHYLDPKKTSNNILHTLSVAAMIFFMWMSQGLVIFPKFRFCGYFVSWFSEFFPEGELNSYVEMMSARRKDQIVHIGDAVEIIMFLWCESSFSTTSVVPYFSSHMKNMLATLVFVISLINVWYSRSEKCVKNFI